MLSPTALQNRDMRIRYRTYEPEDLVLMAQELCVHGVTEPVCVPVCVSAQAGPHRLAGTAA